MIVRPVREKSLLLTLNTQQFESVKEKTLQTVKNSLQEPASQTDC